MSWTPATKVEKKDSELRLINQIVDGNKGLLAIADIGGEQKGFQRQITQGH